MVEQADPGFGGVEAAVFAGDGDLEHVAEGAGDLDAGRAAADDDDVQRATLDERRVAIDLFEQAEDPRAQPGGIVERVERERVLGGARRAEEVRLRSGGHHERVAGPRLAVARGDGSSGGVHAGDVGEVHVDVVLVGEHVTQRVRDVSTRELRGRDLVEEGLELVVVVAVDQRDVDVVVVGELLGATEAGEPAADDHDTVLVLLVRHGRAPVVAER